MNYAFFFCEALAEINLHDGIESIGVSAFQGTAHYNNPDNWEDGIYYLGRYALDYNYETLPTNAVIKSGTLLLGDGGNYGENRPDSMQNISISNVICNSRIGITVAGFLTDSVISNVINRNPKNPAIVVMRENGLNNVSTSNVVSNSVK